MCVFGILQGVYTKMYTQKSQHCHVTHCRMTLYKKETVFFGKELTKLYKQARVYANLDKDEQGSLKFRILYKY